MHVELLRGRKYVIKNSENPPVNTCNDLILHFRFRGQFHNSYVQGHMITKSVLKLVWPTTVLRDKKNNKSLNFEPPWTSVLHASKPLCYSSHFWKFTPSKVWEKIQTVHFQQWKINNSNFWRILDIRVYIPFIWKNVSLSLEICLNEELKCS